MGAQATRAARATVVGSLVEPPRRLVDEAGDVRFGVFAGPVEVINGLDYRLTTPFDRAVSLVRRYFAYKQFQFLGVLSRELILGCAIVDVRYVGSAFIYLYEPASRRLRHVSLRTPLAVGTRIRRTPERGAATFRAGRNRFAVRADPGTRTRTLQVELPGAEIAIEAVLDESRVEPMCVCTRTGPTGWAYTRKVAGAPVTGTVRWGDRRVELGALAACGSSDWSAGYMRRETHWLWGCLAGHLADGRRVGVNAVCGVNESGFTENCFWVDGRRHKLDTVHFEFDRRDLERPWRLRSYDGRLELEFTAEGHHRESLNAWLLASNFTQLFGRFHGALVTEDGERLAIDRIEGFVERHFARW